MNPSQPTGVDLARVALKAARENAKKRGASARQTRPLRRTTRTGGRDPIAFASALTLLVADRAWEVPVTGGSVLDRWSEIAGPELAAHITAVRFHETTGQLDLLPDSAAYRTQIRLLAPRLLACIRDALGTDTVRRLNDLPPGSAPHGVEPPAPPAQEPNPPGPLITRENASPGYQAALAAHRSTVARTTDPTASGGPSHPGLLREPPGDFARALADLQNTPAASGGTSHTRALARARRERDNQITNHHPLA
ncbi:DciA family protein [Streptomyces sp. NPDC001889]